MDALCPVVNTHLSVRYFCHSDLSPKSSRASYQNTLDTIRCPYLTPQSSSRSALGIPWVLLFLPVTCYPGSYNNVLFWEFLCFTLWPNRPRLRLFLTALGPEPGSGLCTGCSHIMDHTPHSEPQCNCGLLRLWPLATSFLCPWNILVHVNTCKIHKILSRKKARS